MSNKYIKTPKAVTISAIQENGWSLSPSQYMELDMPNENYRLVSDFLTRKLKRVDLGTEVGADNYIGKSSHYFIRTKSLQDHTFLPEITKETTLPIMPSSFLSMNLKKGDLIISKDSNIGEIAILDKDYPNHMLSGALYKLPVEDLKYYLLAFIKHPIFREQLDAMVPRGATIRHAKTMFLDCKIPMPNHNAVAVVKYIEALTQAIVNKESLIRIKHEAILSKIKDELRLNQSDNAYHFEMPTYNEIVMNGRLDTNMYRDYFKRHVFEIKNYAHGYHNIFDLGFRLSRGQNLQISNIGKSVYSDTKHKNFYTLVLPKFLSKYGTIKRVEYLGNEHTLKTLQNGDLIFGAEGFEKGRSIVIVEDADNYITNIHGITIQQDSHNIDKAIFVKLILDYFRDLGLIDLYAVGGNGGSLAQKYWENIPFPNFNDMIQREIVSLYHNRIEDYNINDFTIDDFLNRDSAYNVDAGIYELDKTAKQLKALLNTAIDDIVNDREVKMPFKIDK